MYHSLFTDSPTEEILVVLQLYIRGSVSLCVQVFILGSQQNWVEGTEFSHVPPSPTDS